MILNPGCQVKLCFSVSISGHLITLRNCHAMSKLSLVSAQPGLNANGTAIEGVCVTGEAIRLIVPVVSMELSRWQAGMAQFLQSRRMERD